MTTWPRPITASPDSTPSQWAGSRMAKERYIARHISTIDATGLRCHTIRAAMPTDIDVAMSSVCSSTAAPVPTSMDTGMSRAMPASIAASICR